MKNPAEFESIIPLLKRLKTYAVNWSGVSSKNNVRDIVEYEPGIDREERDLDVANVVSSEIRIPDEFFSDTEIKHMLAIDIDLPAFLIPSSTPGHSHLYVDVAIPHHRYMALLSALADAGVIEKGYAEVSIKRGHSDLRLPWVSKGDPSPAPLPEVPLPVLPVQVKPAPPVNTVDLGF